MSWLWLRVPYVCPSLHGSCAWLHVCVWVKAVMCMEINAECVHSFQIPICNICYSYLGLFAYAVGFAPYNWMKQCYSISFNRIIMHRKFTIQLFNNLCLTMAHFIFTHWIWFKHSFILFTHVVHSEQLFQIFHFSFQLFKFFILTFSSALSMAIISQNGHIDSLINQYIEISACLHY